MVDGSAIRVLIVDDDDVARAALTEYMAAADDIVVVGVCRDGAAALEFAAEGQVDVVLMDIDMPRMDGIAATEALGAICPGARVVMLTALGIDRHLEAALRAGAVGFILKSAHAGALIDAVRGAHKGLSSIPTEALGGIAVRPMPPVGSVPRLSSREKDVLAELCRGSSNAEIAGRLFLAESSVKGVVTRLMIKLDADSRLKAVVRAHELGLAG